MNEIDIVQENGLSVLLGFYLPRLIEWVKRAQWFPWLTCDTERTNRVVGAVTSVLVAAGLTWTFSNGESGWQLVIGADTEFKAFLIAVARQFMLQQFFFEQRKASKASDPPEAQ